MAEALEAEKLILLTDTEGIKDSADSETFYSVLSRKEIYRMIDEGKIVGGMIPKVKGGIAAIEAGVNSVHILDGRVPHCLLLEIFTDHGIGTMITR